MFGFSKQHNYAVAEQVKQYSVYTRLDVTMVRGHCRLLLEGKLTFLLDKLVQETRLAHSGIPNHQKFE